MHLITSAEAPRFDLPGIEFTGLASPSRGSREICAWCITVAAGLRSPEPHTIDRDEIFMVVSGAIQFAPDGVVVRAGDAMVVPAGAPIQLMNPLEEPAQVYVVIRADFSASAADGSPIGTPPWAR